MNDIQSVRSKDYFKTEHLIRNQMYLAKRCSSRHDGKPAFQPKPRKSNSQTVFLVAQDARLRGDKLLVVSSIIQQPSCHLCRNKQRPQLPLQVRPQQVM